jgi:hypothetical protein
VRLPSASLEISVKLQSRPKQSLVNEAIGVMLEGYSIV